MNEALEIARSAGPVADDGVFVIGDATAIPIPGRWQPDVPLMLPKAGVFAHSHGEVVARNIAAEINGARPAATFCGDGYCMLEKDVFPKLATEGRLFGYPFSGQWYNTGTLELYEQAIREWKDLA